MQKGETCVISTVKEGEHRRGRRELREEETYEFNTPAEKSGLEVLIIGEFTTLEDLDRIDNGDTTVELATGNVVI